MDSALFTSTTYEWATPQAFFDALDAEFGFTLDPCATPTNAKCSTFFTISDDGLAQSWAGHVVFMNPPYGRQIRRWVRKAYESALAGATVVCLLPARTDTTWWHDHVMKGEVRFVRGRLKFGNASNAAPFPSAVVVFRAVTNPRGAFDHHTNQLDARPSANRIHHRNLRACSCHSRNTPSIHRLDTPNRKGDC